MAGSVQLKNGKVMVVRPTDEEQAVGFVNVIRLLDGGVLVVSGGDMEWIFMEM